MRALALATPTDKGSPLKRQLLTFFWTFCTILWSLFTPPHKTFPARVSLFQPAWILRIYLHESTWIQDLLLFLCTHSIYTYWTGIWRLPTPNILKWIDFGNDVTLIYIETFSLLALCGGLAGGIVYRGHLMKAKQERSENLRLQAQSIDEQLLPPLLIPSRTSHSRLFPEKHAFSYSYLFVGIPVGMKGRINNVLSVDGPGQQGHAWFHVSCTEYLARGGGHLGLAEKLKRYLHSQGVTDRDYSFAYLVTAPKLFGYSFNPVSFWYLYDEETTLKFMVLEVNNTFDERRMYLLRAESARYQNGSAMQQSTDALKESPGKLVFTESWEKDFHVSPFNSRKGSYSLRAIDPLAAYEESGHVSIDNTIVLRSSKESAKVVARVYSEGTPREAMKIQSSELYRFIAGWWWVGLATFPRIVWEAQKLFFRRKLHVWYRPEVTESSIGKTYTDDERVLECFFHAFLRESVEQSREPLRVKYLPAHAAGEEIVLYSSGSTYEEERERTLTLEVLSPAFYSRFVHYAHAKEGFDRECLATDEKNRTLIIENAKLLPQLLATMGKFRPKKSRRQAFVEQMRWSFLRRLQCPPPDQTYSHSGATDTEYEIADIRTFRDSELDSFVKHRCDDANVYLRIVTKLFLAQRFTLGVPALLSVLDWLLRFTLMLATLYYCDRWKDVDILRPRELAPKDITAHDVKRFGTLILLANTAHLWSLVKG